MVGEQIGRYRIDGTLGTGAMGVVYRAFDTQIQRPVALKTIRKELLIDEHREDLMARFRNEVIAAGRLVHPNIVTVFDFGEDNDNAFIAMELVEGKPLNRLIPRNERADRGLVTTWITQLLTALDFAHGMNIVHRDIKPGNLLITPQQQLKITDFGVAKIDATTMTQVGSVVGTPSYMSPEQFRGDAVDGRADLFSVAVILYQLLTGSRPFQGSPTAVMHGIMSVTPPAPSEVQPEVPTQYDAVVMKGLERSADNRHASARAFSKALQAAFQLDLAASHGTDPEATVLAEEFRVTLLRPAAAGAVPTLGGATTAELPSLSAQASALGTSPSNWSPNFLKEVEQSLMDQIGPVAGPLVRKMAAECTDFEELSGRILAKMGSDTVRGKVREKFNGLLAKHGAGMTGTGRLMTGTGTAPSAVDVPVASTSSGIGPNQLQSVERMLAPLVGPIASVLVKRTASKAVGSRQFYSMLAEHIPDNAKRAKFLHEVGMT